MISLINRARRQAASGGAAPANPDFVSTWDTTQAGSASDTVVLPLRSGGTYSGTIDWGDSSSDPLSYANRSHTYAAGGTYTITISGNTFYGFRFVNAGDMLKITDISNWGFIDFADGTSAFSGCANLAISAIDAPIITTSSFSYLFYNCTSLTTPDLSAWNTASVSDFTHAFRGCTSFDGDITTWDVSNATNLGRMFQDSAFNQDVSGFDTTSVLTLNFAFYNSDAFRQSLANWSVSQVTAFTSFMQNATGMSTANYDATLIAWDAQGTMAFSGTVNFGGSKYTAGGAAEAARTSLISKWGGIVDGGAAP